MKLLTLIVTKYCQVDFSRRLWKRLQIIVPVCIGGKLVICSRNSAKIGYSGDITRTSCQHKLSVVS